jgi:hypothetical protein
MPAGHSHINAKRRCAHITATTETPIAKIASQNGSAHRLILPVTLGCGGHSTGFDVNILHQHGDAVSLPFTIVEFFAGGALDNCSVRIECIQPSYSGPFDLGLQGLKSSACDAAPNAVPAMRHGEINVVGPWFPIAGLTSGGK